MFKEIMRGFANDVTYCIKVNTKYCANLIFLLLPYVMYIIGQYVMLKRGSYSINVEVIIPIVVIAIASYLKELSARKGFGSSVPIPKQRFTKVDNDGEVTVENMRLQEMLLWVADVEDWMHRKGWL